MELGRAVWHFLFIGVVGLAVYRLDVSSARFLTLSLFPLLLLINFIRIKNRRFRECFNKIFSFAMRKDEYGGGLGALLAAGVSISVLVVFFGKPENYMALWAFAICDPAARIVGKRFGKRHIGEKTLAGSAACFISICAVLLPVYTVRSFVAALVGTGVELLQFKHVDDNLTVPLAIAAVLALNGL